MLTSHDDDEAVENICVLHLLAHYGNEQIIRSVINGKLNSTLRIALPIDPDSRKVIASQNRFRVTLSETLSFWVFLAAMDLITESPKLYFLMPNFLPEDSGPDGIALIYYSEGPKVELRSVKSSINNPQGLISSSSFRSGGKPERANQLDDFYLYETGHLGFDRIDRLLFDLSEQMTETIEERFRDALLADCAFNASVVADEDYGERVTYEGILRLKRKATDLIATFVSSVNWNIFCENVQIRTLKLIAEIEKEGE